jgi:hypothetical protein
MPGAFPGIHVVAVGRDPACAEAPRGSVVRRSAGEGRQLARRKKRSMSNWLERQARNRRRSAKLLCRAGCQEKRHAVASDTPNLR